LLPANTVPGAIPWRSQAGLIKLIGRNRDDRLDDQDAIWNDQ